ncbi:MAG TPA: aminotransferase class V-fold PLP-dependent enzyme [Tepidisphaeraceae bacterium]|nr:aminotransferase class V-fold PLP-dependent enzyme [Tepidisphaeraceae bacterium]
MAELKDYIGNADVFPILGKWVFFNHAGVCPLPKPAADAFRMYAGQAELDAYLDTGWYASADQLRISAAKMINAHRDEIAFIKNTSEGISIVARGIEWQWGDVIVTTGVEYPANIYPWMEVVRSHGAKMVLVPEEPNPAGGRVVPTEKILQAAADPRCRIVTLSHVEFASGQRHDLARIGKFCRENNKFLCVDAIQTMGVMPIDVQAMNIDYLSADGHKWLLGPEGAGIFYCRRELIERTRPLMLGWMNVVDAQNFGNYNYTLKSDAGRFECGSWNIPGLLSLKVSLEMLLSLGTEHVADRLHALGERLIKGLIEKGYGVISPRGLGQWSGIISFTSPIHDHNLIVRRLRKEHRIEIAMREGRLRASPHFYNTEEQIDKLVELLPAH